MTLGVRAERIGVAVVQRVVRTFIQVWITEKECRSDHCMAKPGRHQEKEVEGTEFKAHFTGPGTAHCTRVRSGEIRSWKGVGEIKTFRLEM